MRRDERLENAAGLSVLSVARREPEMAFDAVRPEPDGFLGLGDGLGEDASFLLVVLGRAPDIKERFGGLPARFVGARVAPAGFTVLIHREPGPAGIFPLFVVRVPFGDEPGRVLGDRRRREEQREGQAHGPLHRHAGASIRRVHSMTRRRPKSSLSVPGNLSREGRSRLDGSPEMKYSWREAGRAVPPGEGTMPHRVRNMAILASVILVLGVLPAALYRIPFGGAKTISPAAAKEMLLSRPERTALVDVRTPAEFGQGHLRGAVNWPLDDILRQASSGRPARAAAGKDADRDLPGGASAASKPRAGSGPWALADVFSVRDGMIAWTADADNPARPGIQHPDPERREHGRPSGKAVDLRRTARARRFELRHQAGLHPGGRDLGHIPLEKEGPGPRSPGPRGRLGHVLRGRDRLLHQL